LQVLELEEFTANIYNGRVGMSVPANTFFIICFEEMKRNYQWLTAPKIGGCPSPGDETSSGNYVLRHMTAHATSNYCQRTAEGQYKRADEGG